MEAETFVGLDIAKNSVVATAVDPLGQRIDPSTQGPSDAELIACLRRRPGVKRGTIDAAHALLRVVYALLKKDTPYTPHTPERASGKVVTPTSSRRSRGL